MYKAKVMSLHWGYSIGGVGQYAALIDGVSNGHAIHVRNVAILNPSRQVDIATLNSLKDKITIQRNGLFNLSWLGELQALCKDYGPDLVISHGFNGYFISMILKAYMGGNFKLVSSYHGSYHAITPAKKIPGLLFNAFAEYFLRRRVYAVVAVADYCKNYLVKKNVASDKITVIHNGIETLSVETGAREKLRREWNIGEDVQLIGVASRLDPVKGVEYLLEAFIQIAGKFQNSALVVIGTGTLDEKLKSMAATNGLVDRVFFTGFRSDIPQCLEAMDIFALPSLAEYHSIGLLEAMRAGKAILATDVGGNTESVRSEQEAIIIPSADVPAIADALRCLLSDPELCRQLGDSARKRFFGEFTVDRTVDQTADWLLSCAASAAIQQTL